ncbi:MAG: 23S rRNA (adenine(1618)-N(6))-methyltransferase RlmF [Prosthecobacter sp.]
MSSAPATTKDGLHPRNRFRTRYDFPRLVSSHPTLGRFVKDNGHGELSIDYADPQAVKALNAALLKDAYGLAHWDLPPGFLCPPIPGRSDYIHHLADLIGERRGPAVRVLDVGTGANCIYPLIGASEYGWSFVGAEVDSAALRWAKRQATANASVAGLIECRQQTSAAQCFKGIIKAGERFDLTMCNPPFHASAAEAAAGTRRKVGNLGGKQTGTLNFAGKAGELWCEGGELAFIRRMIAESVDYALNVGWFTTLVSKSEHLPKLEKALRQAKAAEVRVLEMAQGQKKSRALAWRFERS